MFSLFVRVLMSQQLQELVSALFKFVALFIDDDEAVRKPHEIERQIEDVPQTKEAVEEPEPPDLS